MVRQIMPVEDPQTAVEALTFSEESFRQLTEHVNAVFWILSFPEQRVVYVSPAYQRVWGLDPRREVSADFIDTWLHRVHAEDRTRVAAAYQANVLTGNFDEEYRIVLPDGRIRWMHDRGFPVRDATGKVYRIAGIAEDITTQKQTAAELRETHQELERRVEERTAALSRINVLLREEIAERKRAEEVARANEERYRNLFENANDGIVTFTLDGVMTSVNRGIERMLGRQREELVGQLVERFLTPASWALVQDRTRRFLAGEKPPSALFEVELRHADGHLVPLEMRTRVIRDAEGKPIGFQGIGRDITERKQAETALCMEAQVSRGQTAVLTRTLSALAAVPALDRFLSQVLAAIAEQLQAQHVVLWLHQPTEGELVRRMTWVDGRILSATQEQETGLPASVLEQEVPLWGELTRLRRPIVVSDVARDQRIFFRKALVEQGVRSELLVPLLLGETVSGILILRNLQTRDYRLEEIDLAQALAVQVTLSIQLARLAEQGRHAAVLEERTRLAQEIHDSLAQGFTGIILQLEAALRVLTDDVEKARGRLGEALALARDSLAEARRSVQALRPQALEHQDLPTALLQLATRAMNESSAQVAFHLHGSPHELSAEVEHHLLRICQEAVHNACAHAQASVISINLGFRADHVALRVQDDGCGFVPQATATHSGFGLVSMRERATQVGGQFTLSSRPGQGTLVTVLVPYATRPARESTPKEVRYDPPRYR